MARPHVVPLKHRLREGSMLLSTAATQEPERALEEMPLSELADLARNLKIGARLCRPGSLMARMMHGKLTLAEAVLSTRRFELAVEATVLAVPTARRALAAFLAAGPGSYPGEDAALVVSELVTNAVLHSASREGGPVTVRCGIELYHLRLEVEDLGGEWTGPQPDTENGRGLLLVAELSGGCWGRYDLPHGHRVVWAHLLRT